MVVPTPKHVRKVGIVIAIVAVFLIGLAIGPKVLAPPAPVTGEEMWKDIQARGKIVIGSSPDWPPMEYLDPDSGEFIGYEVDLCELVAERLGLSVEWKKMGFESIIPSIKAKKIDIGVSGFGITPPRLKVVQYAVPIDFGGPEIVMLKSRAEELGITMIESLEKLDELGLSCGTGVGTLQSEKLSKHAPHSLRTYDTFDLALADMKRGGIDCVYSSAPVTSWWILKAEEAGEEPIVVIYGISGGPTAWVMHKDNDVFASKINGVLAELYREGKIKELRTKWKL